jgi:hypothetical protein
MRISVDAQLEDFQSALNWVGGLIGVDLDQRVEIFKRHERRNPLLANHFHEHFALEFALAKARKYRRNTGRAADSKKFFPLFSFVISAYRIHQALPDEARIPFEGRLRTALNGTHGIRPFAYEITLATHLMSKGWDIEFVDYCGSARFDFLARRGEVEIEIECKSTSGDTGRKIHRQELARLADLILPTTQALVETPGCHLILVTLPDRLGKSTNELSDIASAVAAAANQKSSVSGQFARGDYIRCDLTSWPDPRRDASAREFFERQFGFQNTNLFFHVSPNSSIVAVMIRSAKADSVTHAIAEQAKQAAEQCSGTRPALIALNLIDPISRSELEVMLRTANGLHAIAGAVFTGDKRLHVDSIAFTVPQVLKTDGLGSSWLSGPVIALYNPHPLFSCPELRQIFRDA